MVLSGLTLGVSAAGFAFLNGKLKKIDEKIDEVRRDVKKVRDFLESSERARLKSALNTVKGIDVGVDPSTRTALLVNARQVLGEINERYRELLVNSQTIQEFDVVEEYFSVTALAHAMCSAELDMRSQARQDFIEAHRTWTTTSQRVAREFIFKGHPERLLESRYAAFAKTDEIVDWLDFANGTDRQIEWIDELRSKKSRRGLWPDRKVDRSDIMELETCRKLVARNRIFDGYGSQLEYFIEQDLRPSSVQDYVKSFGEGDRVGDGYVLVAEET